MAIEFELKFRADAARLAALLAAYGAGAQTVTMETTYYDIPGGGLSGRGWTLRRRMENGQGVCTLKTPAGGAARREWEVAAADIAEGIEKLCKLDTPGELAALTAGGLVQVCGARFTRRAVAVRMGQSVLELALDSGVLLGGSRTCPLCEVEVELKSGSRADAEAFAAELAREYGLTPEPVSKFGRALALAREDTYGGL